MSDNPHAHIQPVVSDDEADLGLLSMANNKRKFAVAIGVALARPLQQALERGQDNEWFTLADIVPAAGAQVMLRIFRLTDAGLKRLASCKARAMLTRGSDKPLIP